MPTDYLYIVLAVVALIAGILYVRVRRRRRKKKSAPPVRPASPAAQTAGVASTWAPPAMATHMPSPIAPTVVVPPSGSPSWDQPPPSPAKPGQWGAPAAPPRGAGVDRPRAPRCPAGGRAPRLAYLPDPTGAVGDPPRPSLERACAGRLNPASTLFPRLGCSAGVRGATHSCSVVERARTGGLGRPQNRRARRSRRALVVGPIGRAQWLSSLELPRPRRSPPTCSVVTSGAGRARAQPDGRRPRRRGRVPR